MSRATRREMLGAGAAAALAQIATAAVARPVTDLPLSGPDAPLLALCSRFMDLQAQLDAADAAVVTGAPYPDVDGHLDGFIDTQLPILNEMAGLRATTLEGRSPTEGRATSYFAPRLGQRQRRLECPCAGR